MNDLSNKKEEAALTQVEQIIKDNNLDYLVRMRIAFGMTSGLNKPVALEVTWHIYGKDLKEKATVITVVVDEEALEVFPDTKDPKYEKKYIELARKNAVDFLHFLAGKEAVYGKGTTTLGI